MKKMSINDIAREAKVSKSTVSRVLNNNENVSEETRARVQKIIDDLEYKPSDIARNLSNRTSNDVAVALPNIKNPFFSTILTEIMADAIASDMNILLYTTDSLEEELVKTKELKIVEMVYKKRATAIIIYSSLYTKKLEKELRKLRIQVILIGKRVEESVFTQIVYSEEKMAYLGMKSLLEKGYRNIGLLKWKKSEDWRYRGRIDGVEKALNEFGMKYEEKNVFEYGEYQISDDHAKGAFNISNKEIVENMDIEAVFTLTNTAAVGLSRALRIAKRNLPFISFDDNYLFEHLGMDISCVERSPHMIGEVSINLLQKIFKGERIVPETIEFEPTVVFRGSEKFK